MEAEESKVGVVASCAIFVVRARAELTSKENGDAQRVLAINLYDTNETL